MSESKPEPRPECKCSLRTRVVGDGCEVCNPELARWYEEQAALDEARELNELKSTTPKGE